jgi:DNA gyrase subunit B
MASLEGLQAIRARPTMYVGSTDASGLERMLSYVLTIFVNEHLADRSMRLSVDIDDAGWVTIEVDGVGVSVDFDEKYGLPRIETLFSRFLHPEVPHEPATATHAIKHGPHEYFPAVATALSSKLEVETRPGGHAWRLAYAAGSQLQKLEDGGPTTVRGTVVRYLPDESIFDAGVKHDLVTIEKRLRTLALLCPKLDVRLQRRSLASAEGIAGWLREAAPELVKDTLLTAKGTVGVFDVEVAFAWRPRASAPLIRSFVNYLETPAGGSHVRGLTVAIENVIGAKRASRTKKVVSGLVAAVHVGTEWPQMQRGALDDKSARDAVRDVVTRAINDAPWWWERLHAAIG